VKTGETIDELRAYGLKIMQPAHGYRFSLDPLLLVDFASPREGERSIDLGTGCGIIPLLMARIDAGSEITGLELQESMAELAERNAALNAVSDRVSIVRCDVNSVRDYFRVSQFNLVISNPPYRKRGSGKVSPKPGREDARHESTASLADFLAAAKFLCAPSGRICFIYHSSRLSDLLVEASILKLCPMRLRFVHGSPPAEARMFMIELSKGKRSELKVLPPLFVYDAEGEYSEEMKKIFAGRRR
jgi:tRNA1Val (adenine37-N6)-methyltransferase